MAAGDFIPAEEVQQTLVAQWDTAEKEAKDFVREETVEEVIQTMLLEDLEGVVGLMEMEGVGEVVEVTLGEVAGTTHPTPVGEGEDLSMLGKIKQMSVVSIRTDTVG